MSGLSYGLNLPNKAGRLSKRPQPGLQKTLFDDSDPEDVPEVEGAASTVEVFDSAPTRQPIKPLGKESVDRSTLKQRGIGNPSRGDLAASHTANKHAIQAQELDPSVYDYDGVYDSLHAKPKRAAASAGPKYMEKLLEAAEVRKRDQLRAKEKSLLREREAEGDEFADKEKFVTAAYRAQQQELLKLEEEEKEKEAKDAARRQRQGGGMTGLYKEMLEREEAKHDAAVKAVENAAVINSNNDEPRASVDATEAQLAWQMGAEINEDGKVTDKRQLLTAGLNVRPKQPASAAGSNGTLSPAPSSSTTHLPGKGNAKAAMRERQTRMLEQQLEEASKRAAGEADLENEALQRAAKSRKTEGEVSSARERYLQRKKEATAAAAKVTAESA